MNSQSIAYIKKLLTGRARITDKQIFSLIIYSVAMVHCFLCFLFDDFLLYDACIYGCFFNQALKADAGFSLIMYDIGDFTKVNDTYGHDFGDIVLKEVAQIATQLVKFSGSPYTKTETPLRER